MSGYRRPPRFGDRGMIRDEFDYPRDPYRRPEPLRGPRLQLRGRSTAPLDPIDVQAQVIVVDPERLCRDYAEMFLAKMKKIGLITDIIILDRFTSPSQGQPQEHRNMPYEDALKLVARSFDAHLLKLGGEKSDPAPAKVPLASKALDVEEIDPKLSLMLINLAEGKTLKLEDLDKVIAYLEKKREKVTGLENPGQPIATTYQQSESRAPHGPKPVQPPSMSRAASSQADDLQAKINQLFGDSNKQQSTVGLKGPKARLESDSYATNTDSQKKPVGIDFTNPSVQNALQNLMKTGPSILDSLSRGSTQTSSNSSTVKSRRSESPVPAKRAKPGKHVIAGFY